MENLPGLLVITATDFFKHADATYDTL